MLDTWFSRLANSKEVLRHNPIHQWLRKRYHRQPAFQEEGSPHYFSQEFVCDPSHVFVDIELEIDISWEDSRRYQYSKLYYARGPDEPFDESRVVCVRIRENRFRHLVRIRIPDEALVSGTIRFRFDPFPYSNGRVSIYDCCLVTEENSNTLLSASANLDSLKQATRAGVEDSERKQAEIVTHYPESMSLELQPGCNLQCGHCATHGTDKAHATNNRLGAIKMSHLKSLATEVFPHLTLLHLVGRGEPLMVSDALWEVLVGEAQQNRVFLTVVTNGYYIERRITPDVLPLIDTLTVSIDGLSPAVFASNRGGACLETVLKGVQYFHQLRKNACLPRRPKLCISWTLKRNNIAELPRFIKFMAQYEPDRYYMRHLLVCHDKDRSESLLEVPELANRYLAEAYALIAEQGAETDCPPLFNTGAKARNTPRDKAVGSPASPVERSHNGRDKICQYIHRTASIKAQGNMTTCGVYHAAKVGVFDEQKGFKALWNGDVMRSVRRDINTCNEWEQCKNCWFRESRYYSQRVERAVNSAYSLSNEADYSLDAWDYRKPKN